jgi:hypothetical protein
LLIDRIQSVAEEPFKKWEGRMTDATQHQLISDIAHEVITEIAPRELPSFPLTSKAYFASINDPGEGGEPPKPKDEMLGFGLDTAVTYLTPVILALTTEVVTFLAKKVKDSIKEESGELVTKFVKEMFKRIPPAEERDKKAPLAVSREELVQLRQLMLETAKHLRLPNDKTELLVNAVVGKLVIAES